jgi:gliding-associated putative ABC transporter substrate-binding component GldG
MEKIENRKGLTKSFSWIKLGWILVFFIVINFLSSKLYTKYDLTSDKRYSLSETTVNIIDKVEAPILIKVYLEGEFPPEFKRLQSEIKQHLEQLHNLNNNISYRFINPLGKEKTLIKEGLKPSKLAVQEKGKTSQTVIFPWATIIYKNKSENIALLANNAKSQEAILQHAIENLEFLFTDAIYKISKKKQENIAILTGNNELDFIYLDGLLKTLSQYYHLEPFPLDSANVVPQKTLKLLNKFDLAIIAKPTKQFTENEKFTLDQFQANNGKTLWLIDNVIAENDSLNKTGKTLALNRELNLTDLFFNYGARIKYNLVKDLYSSTIKLASGNIGGKTQYKDFLWHYYPLVNPNKEHVISKNIPPVQLKFVSTIDTLKNNIKKTVLLQSSPLSKPYGIPLEISLDEINQKTRKADYNNGNKILGVLLEGKFNSAYKDRIAPFKIKDIKNQSDHNKMILIADGDIIKNEIYQGKPLDLGIDKWTGIKNGNKEFLLNSIQYLLDDEGLLQLRAKNINLQFLDKEKVYQEQGFWQVINFAVPLILLGIFGLGYSFYRKKKYR